MLIGEGGADRHVGGGTGGLADYETSTAGVIASLINPRINAGDAAGDTYSNVHDLAGSPFDDTLVGDDHGNNMLGNAGNDIMVGGHATTPSMADRVPTL